MPSVSGAQHRAMGAAKSGNSTLGIPKEVGTEFAGADEHKGHLAQLPEHVKALSEGGYACMSCGGETMAHGGSVAPHPEMMGEDIGPEEPEGNVPSMTERQSESQEEMRQRAFADAVSYSRHRRGQ